MSVKNFSVKSLKALVFRLGIPWAIEYGICYVLGAVVSDSLLHGRLDQPAAAFGLLAIGTLYRYFNAPRHSHQAGMQLMATPVQLDPEALANLLNPDGPHGDAADKAADKLSGPYL